MSRFNLRRKPRISYYEIEEPNLDEYIYCDECTDFVYEYCAIHGPLLVVPDKKVSRVGIPPWVPNAALTTPKEFVHIAPSYIPGAGLGVFSTLTLPRGVRFGPYKGVHTTDVKSTYCWQIKSPDQKNNIVVDAGDGETSNWLRYVNCSRNWREQNLVAFQYQGKIYYRTIKIIPRFTELLVFYGSEFANALGVDLRRYNAPPRAQYGALPTKKPVPSTNNQDEKSLKPTPRTDENKTKVNEDVKRGNVSSNPEIKGDAVKKPKGKKKQKENKKSTRLEKAPVSDQHQNKLIQGAKKGNLTTTDDKGTSAPPDKKRRRAKPTRQEKLQTPPSAIENHKEVGKEYINLVLDTNNVQYCRITEKYICNECGESFQDKSALNVHIKCHSSIYFHCKVCDYRGVTEDSLQKHMLLHDIERQFPCNICEIRFTVKNNLVKHLRIHSGENPYKCNICDYRCSCKDSLKLHFKIHSGEKPYKCNVCDYRCSHKGNLKRHLRMHSGEKPYKCNVCDYRSSYKTCLDTHLRTHSGEKPYKCNVCDYRCSRKGTLKTHLRIHSGEKPYKCNVCDYRCSQKGHLISHLRIHSGEKPYECNVCDYRCNRKGSLISHFRIHSGEKPYECNICEKRFISRSSLIHHLKIHTR